VRRHGIDAIVCQDPVLGGFAAAHVGRLLGVPVLIEIHTDVYFGGSTDRRSRILRGLFRHALEQATLVRVLTHGMDARIRAEGIRPRATVHIPNRVDLRVFNKDGARPDLAFERLGLGHARPIITSVGRFVLQKGHADLLRAFSLVCKQFPEAALVLIGGGELANDYHDLASRLGIERRVHVVADLPQRELVDVLAATDIYSQPSLPGLGEALPRTLLEAMAMGLPIVATNAAFIPDVIADRRNGVLAPSWRPAALAEAIVELAGDQALAARLGRTALDDARRDYEWDACFDVYRSVLYSMGRHSTSPPQTASRNSGATASGR
jgi:glycosyltransferase involved in cell wall biosynthesis